MHQSPFKAVVLSGCGSLSACHIGFLLSLESQIGKLKEIKGLKHVIGVSAGSIIGFLWSLGIDLQAMFEFLSILKSEHLLHPNSLPDVILKMGLNNAQPIIGFMQEFLDNHGIPFHNMTFLEMWRKYRRQFTVVVTDADDMQPVYVNHKTFPSMQVLDAVKASCTIPLWFNLHREGERNFLDGSLSDPLPFSYTVNVLKVDPQQIAMHSIDCMANGEYTRVDGLKDLLNNLLLYLNKSLARKTTHVNQEIEAAVNKPFLVRTTTTGYHPLNFDLTEDDLDYLWKLAAFNCKLEFERPQPNVTTLSDESSCEDTAL